MSNEDKPPSECDECTSNKMYIFHSGRKLCQDHYDLWLKGIETDKPFPKENMDDLGFCVNCIQGVCVPGEVKYQGQSLKRNGCVAVSLYVNKSTTNPETLCECFRLYPDKHPLEKFGEVTYKSLSIKTEGSSSEAIIQKPIVEVED